MATVAQRNAAYRKFKSLKPTDKARIKATTMPLGEFARANDLPLEVVVAVRGGTTPPKGM